MSIHLTQASGDSFQIRQQPILYIFAWDIKKFYQELLSKNVEIANSLDIRRYQMEDFDVRDPDGYMITFGQGTT